MIARFREYIKVSFILNKAEFKIIKSKNCDSVNK
jgi:hypothetical protein